jgi:hypothetical protein
MPHYADGTKAQLGDLAQGTDSSGRKARGEVIQIHECDSCNLVIARIYVMGQTKIENGKRVLVEHGYPDVRAEPLTFTAKGCEKIA